MRSDRHIWHIWARKLHSWGVGDWVASLLEVAGPITLLGAQVVYISQPFFSHSGAKNHLTALAELLEEPETTRSFIKFLREGTAQ